LRSIMEGILLDTMFDLPSLEGESPGRTSGNGRGCAERRAADENRATALPAVS
jgi:hypothetical protein